jgi:hypothetical protein
MKWMLSPTMLDAQTMNAPQLMQQQRPVSAHDEAGVNHGLASHFLMVMFTLTACLGELAAAQLPRLERDVYKSRMGSALVAVEELPGWIDPESGARIVQLTSRAVTSSNVHMEQRFASADGQRIVIQRFPFGRPPEVWVYDLSRRMMLRIGEGKALTASHSRNTVYYVVLDADKAEARLMRLDLADLSTRVAFRFDKEQAPRKGAVSADERWFVGGPFATGGDVYRLTRIDLQNGKADTLCEVRDMWNPHLQIDPGDPRRLLVQINRSGQTADGASGATLAIVDVATGDVKPLPVGRPHTPLLSGHETWAGRSGRVIFTVAPGSPKSPLTNRGVYAIAPGDDQAQPIALGQPFNHLAVSDDGRFFIVDNHRTQDIFVGSIASGRFQKLCGSRTRQGRPQTSHAHPYMTPDNRHVIFNSNVTGVAQVYAAPIPAGFLEKLTTP